MPPPPSSIRAPPSSICRKRQLPAPSAPAPCRINNSNKHIVSAAAAAAPIHKTRSLQNIAPDAKRRRLTAAVPLQTLKKRTLFAGAPKREKEEDAYVWSDEQRARIQRRSYLGPRGYTVWADALCTTEEKAAVRALANFQPVNPNPLRPAPPPVVLAMESDTKWFLPQAQALKVFGVPAKILLPYKAPADLAPPLSFAQNLYPAQIPILAKCLGELSAQYARQKFAGIVIQAKCGEGKTVMGIFLAVVAVPRILAGLITPDEILDAGKMLQPLLQPAPLGAVLILLNKGFLVNQWRERIRAACPGARIGQIQGKKHEVDGCHFVLGMIQSMWSKTYTPATFAGFQTVIVDEAHCICSAKYFNALRQIVTPCMIALSATVQKPNGMEEILFRYVGPIAYRAPMEATKHKVTVRIVQYACHHESEYSRLDYNRQGELDYSTTIGRVSMYPPRIDAAADTLLRFTQENPKTQILVLSTLKEPLEELAKRITAWNDQEEGGGNKHCPTFGFYVGGMKIAKLEESSAQQIILATYSMAAEALDIPTLDGVFLYNSKATITQSIGRPMRIMNDNKFIYDFADAHSVFQGQLFKKRLPIYRGFGYHVFKCTYADLSAKSPLLENDPAIWRVVSLPAGARAAASTKCGGSSGDNKTNQSAIEDDGKGCCAFGDDDDDDDDSDSDNNE